MKKINPIILCLIMAFAVMGFFPTQVKADEATLSSLKVEAQDNAGDRVEVKLTPEFSPEITEYEATVANGTIKLVLTPTTTEADAEYETDWVAMDVGDNETYVYVTAADGTKQTYTIYTKCLTREEQETWEPEEETEEEETNETEEPTEAPVENKIFIGEVEMEVVSDFDKNLIPEGFAKSTYSLKGTDVTAIAGEKKPITAIWLKPVADGETSVKEGFYVYDEERDLFYEMKNIYIKSRMYTAIEVDEYDAFLEDYETSVINIVDCDIKAWILDEANSLYLVYAMNWEGETNLYCYDDIEKCFQRYIIDSAASTQLEGANEKIHNLQDKNNELVKKYNSEMGLKWKIIAGLLIVIVILFFTSLNLALSLKSKRLKEDMDDDYDREDSKKSSPKKEKKKEKDYFDYDEDDDDEELFKLVEEEFDFQNVEEQEEELIGGNFDEGAELSSEPFLADEPSIDVESVKKVEKSFFDEPIAESPAVSIVGSPIVDTPVVEKVGSPIVDTPVVEKVGSPVVDTAPVKQVEIPKQSFVANNEETFNEDALKDILATAFPKEQSDDDDDDDGFTFI